jgi:phosphatidylinositol 4-phosphatase
VFSYVTQEDLNYLQIAEDGTVLRRQSGVIRTNCLDCLDRTNLVMSVFANRSLHEQLVSFGVSPQEGYASGTLDHLFKRSWADNGDAISRQYAGTGALKSDFTRTGKRKTKGVVRDGINSLSRYVINNFRDGVRQAAIDLFLNTKQVRCWCVCV